MGGYLPKIFGEREERILVEYEKETYDILVILMIQIEKTSISPIVHFTPARSS